MDSRSELHGVFAEPHADVLGAETDAARGTRAQEMARRWGGGVLETVAQAEAVLLVREAEEYYDEGEVIVDLFSSWER